MRSSAPLMSLMARFEALFMLRSASLVAYCLSGMALGPKRLCDPTKRRTCFAAFPALAS